MREKPRYYRLELDDYSAAAFTSFGKYYYDIVLDRLERVIHQIVELQTAE